MSDKIPYLQMKQIFDQFVTTLFSGEAKIFHGWDKVDFLDVLSQEILADAEEETYDIVLTPPSTLQ